MKKCFLLLILVFGIMTSCISFKNEIKRNSEKTELIFNRLVNENGNAFAITATHINFSRVWSYENSKIKVYEIAQGKVLKTYSYHEQDRDWLKLVKETNGFKFDECIELDGDGLKYLIIKEGSKIQNNLPINIKCFIDKENKNHFYTQLANDIKSYKLNLY